MDAVLHSSAKTGGKDTWQTPAEFLALVRRVAPIGLDPCTVHTNPTRAGRMLTPWDDGLCKNWPDYCLNRDDLVFVNPPYSGLREWMAKCARTGAAGLQIIALIPARTDTRAWHEHVNTAQAVCFWKGRIRFVDPATGEQADPAPFPVAVVYWGGNPDRFVHVFNPYGMCLYL